MVQDAVGGEGRQWAAGPAFWREVFDHLGAGLAVVDSSGLIVAVNPAAEELLGRTAGVMVGEDFHDLLHRRTDGTVVPREECPLLAALALGIPARGGGGGFLRGDGQLLPVVWSGAPVARGGCRVGMTVLFARTTVGREASEDRASRVTALEDLTGRMALVAEISAILAQTLDTEETLSRLGRFLVPRLTDWAAIDLRVEGEVRRVAVTGPEDRDAEREAWQGTLPAVVEHSRSPLVRVLHGGEAVLLGPGEIAAPPDSALAAVQAGFLQSLGATSAVTVPLGTARQVTGALTLVRTGTARPFDAADLALAGDMGRRVGLAIDNARLFGRQREIAEAMQRNLLASLPQPGPLRLAARYQPAPVGSQVGGDWYDAFPLRDGATALVIGDVVGHDLAAAAGMAQLHGMLRALAWDRTRPPSAIVDRLDDAIPAITSVPMATLVLARVEGPESGPWRLRWTSAGHPPPLLATPDGHAEYLEQGQSLLLGARLGGGRLDATAPLPPGSTLLLYTDGLVEVRGTDLDTGLGRLRRHAAALARRPLEEFCDQVLARMSSGSTDDIALLALRVPD
ncbi:SpoIIE family protein phosphatase [Streptomyces radiopugnans]|uniref:protein-serine/threonine phosphatase n=1 Tax=Streptomyces radiopugnans TaxID=403935 RepID=A0A1H9CTA9_9ACTN|nr:SpoIIE family protein phosphatase [Streptomyces radiopugnans]SEQ04466.1 PAS domain S-box-containing protein [Streptomyces radiopugnans]